jgi:hypothetical protein
MVVYFVPIVPSGVKQLYIVHQVLRGCSPKVSIYYTINKYNILARGLSKGMKKNWVDNR